jgi:tRNA pseudouridine38-40 synthase
VSDLTSFRYFLELSYLGTRYAGFQIQENAHTVQAEVERALTVLLREEVRCTGSSRTDAGVHAFQNYFHFNVSQEVPSGTPYRLNAILPPDIAVLGLWGVGDGAHCRFDAISRSYRYVIYRRKDPFLDGRGWFLPYPLDGDALQACAAMIPAYEDFSAFAKRNSQAKTHICRILHSTWEEHPWGWAYRVEANRFLRGMVRGLVGTMVQAGRGKLDMDGFRSILEKRDNQLADFTAPGKGLFLERVRFPEGYFGTSLE